MNENNDNTSKNVGLEMPLPAFDFDWERETAEALASGKSASAEEMDALQAQIAKLADELAGNLEEMKKENAGEPVKNEDNTFPPSISGRPSVRDADPLSGDEIALAARDARPKQEGILLESEQPVSADGEQERTLKEMEIPVPEEDFAENETTEEKAELPEENENLSKKIEQNTSDLLAGKNEEKAKSRLQTEVEPEALKPEMIEQKLPKVMPILDVEALEEAEVVADEKQEETVSEKEKKTEESEENDNLNKKSEHKNKEHIEERSETVKDKNIETPDKTENIPLHHLQASGSPSPMQGRNLSGVELDNEDIKVAPAKEKKSAGYGATMTLLAVLLVVGLALVAAWVWFGNYEAHEAQVQLSEDTQLEMDEQTEGNDLVALLESPEYTIRYSLTDDDVGNMVSLQHAGENTLIQDQTVNLTYLNKDGRWYEIDTNRDTAERLVGETALLKRYLVLLPDSLGTLVSEKMETTHGALYWAQEYENYIGYFSGGELKWVTRKADEAEFIIKSVELAVEEDFDLLPGETPTRREETSESSTSGTKVETINVDLPDNTEIGEIAVGKYVVFD